MSIIYICFQNNSNKAVKKIKVSVRQFADICLFSTAQYKCTVDEKVKLQTDRVNFFSNPCHLGVRGWVPSGFRFNLE